MILKGLNKLFKNENLTFNESKTIAELIMQGAVNNSQISALLTALKIKGETSTEIAGFATAMRNSGVKINVPDENLIDVCGTGGDNSGSFNISTAVAFVVAGAGIKVAKHGNRSITSKSGSSDVLEELGVNINLSPQKSQQALSEIGIAFLFAPIYHPAMKNVAPVRLELGFKTIFNILGPLTNPANTKRQLIGTSNDEVALKMAEAAKLLGMESVAFVCTNNQYDEITLTDTSKIVKLLDNKITEEVVTPKSFGFPHITLADIKGGTPHENAQIILSIFTNQSNKAQLNVVTANAALAIQTANRTISLTQAIEIALDSIYSGKALNKLNELIEFGNGE